MSILPNIVNVAQEYQIDIDPRTLGKREVLGKCPFCDNGHHKKTRRYYLSLNEDRNVFRCWYCNEQGGVLRFLSLLSGEAEGSILERLRNENKRSNYQKHNAEKLTTRQLQLIGYGRINWMANRKFDYDLYVAYRERVWDDWQRFVDAQVKVAYRKLWLQMLKGDIALGFADVKKLEQDIGVPLMQQVLQYFSTEGIDSDMDRWDLEEFVCQILKIPHREQSL
ncbi:hypothetical protein AAGS61_17775 [Lysinibacillus sp. KU-BSD001]|uniref:hypothetical protein n=1 Tax=Lysinibacillus sp. KU-BSD001 TaxID=3141328 RepID=UPI0036E48170